MWSDWASEAFGERVDELRELIPAALAQAHKRARAAHDAGQAKNNRVYGYALWDFAHEEIASAIRTVDAGPSFGGGLGPGRAHRGRPVLRGRAARARAGEPHRGLPPGMIDQPRPRPQPPRSAPAPALAHGATTFDPASLTPDRRLAGMS